MTLLDLERRPEVLSTGGSTPSGTDSRSYAWAEPHSVQYGIPNRTPPTVSMTIS